MKCRTDGNGFHVDADGRRLTKRDGRDGYAYRCTECGTVGDIKQGTFVPR